MGAVQTPAKTAVRDQLLTARSRLGAADLVAAGAALAQVLTATAEVRRAATVAAYVSTGSEPGTGLLLDALRAAGTRVLLPVLLPDDDLDWGVLDGSGASGGGGLVRGRRGLLEPTGERLGVDGVARADVVVVPGLAADAAGTRLGRGGGSYDRALGRVGVGTPVWVLLHDGELRGPGDPLLPREPHDRPVTGAVTPVGLVPLPR